MQFLVRLRTTLHFESHVHPFAAGTMASDDSDLFNVAMLIDELKVRVRQAHDDATTPAAATAAEPALRKSRRGFIVFLDELWLMVISYNEGKNFTPPE